MPQTAALIPVQRFPWGDGKSPAERYLATLPAGSSIASQTSALRVVSRDFLGCPDFNAFPWHLFTVTAAAALGAQLRDEYGWRTCRRMMAAVRGTLMVCKDERWLVTPSDEHGNRIAQSDHYAALAKQLRVKKKGGKDVGRVVTDDESRAVMKACSEDGIDGARDAVIFILGIVAGLRREEISDVVTKHVDLGSGAVAVIDGKGGKDRVTSITKTDIPLVKRWLSLRQERWPDLTSSSPLIVGAYGTGIGPQTVWRHLVSRLSSAGVEAFTTHDMRRTFVTRQRKAGTALRVIQAAMGHASIDTTASYDRTESDEVVEAIGKVKSPW